MADRRWLGTPGLGHCAGAIVSRRSSPQRACVSFGYYRRRGQVTFMVTSPLWSPLRHPNSNFYAVGSSVRFVTSSVVWAGSSVLVVVVFYVMGVRFPAVRSSVNRKYRRSSPFVFRDIFCIFFRFSNSV